MFNTPNIWAFCSRLRWRWRERCSAISSQWPGGVTLWPGTSAQKWAYAVWSAVRVVLLAAPRLLVLLKSAAYCALSRAGGRAGRNCATFEMVQGVTCPHCGASAELTPGVNSYWPAVPPAGVG